MKLNMTIDEALAFADEWSRGMTLHEGSRGWRVVCMLLAEQVRADREHIDLLTAALIVAKEALEYHVQQTRPIDKTTEAIATINEALENGK